MRGLYDITEGLCPIFALQQQCRLLLVKINFVQRDAFKAQQVSCVKYSAAVKFTGKGFLCKVLILMISIECLSSSCRRLQLGKCNYPSSECLLKMGICQVRNHNQDFFLLRPAGCSFEWQQLQQHHILLPASI